MNLLIVGCGYVGRPVARAWQSQGGRVLAVTRGGPSVDELGSLGIESVSGDWLDTVGSWSVPFQPSHILVSVPHRADDRYGEQTHVVGLKNLARRFPDARRWLALSTTGVYDQCDGDWVDETTAVRPVRIGPRVAWEAEKYLIDQLSGQRATTSLRLAGIYGPGRVPLLDKLRSGQPIPSGEGWLNLIHLDDIVAAIVALLRADSSDSLYVLADGHPVERRRFYRDAADILGTCPPQFVDPQPDTPRAARSRSSKRINPARILRDMELVLRYPDHRTGLQSLVQRV